MNNVTINTAVKIQITCMMATYKRIPWHQTLLLRHDSKRSPLVLRGHQGAVYDLAWHESAGCWISAGGDGVLAAWKHGEEHGKALAHHSSPFYTLTLWKGMVVGGNSTGELVMHTPEGPRIMHVHKAPVFALFADQDEVLWSGDGQGNLCRWEWQRAGAVVTHQWVRIWAKSDTSRHIHLAPWRQAAREAGWWSIAISNAPRQSSPMKEAVTGRTTCPQSKPSSAVDKTDN